MPVGPDHPDAKQQHHPAHQLRYLSKDGSKSIKVVRTADGPQLSTPLSPKDVNKQSMASTDYPRTLPSLGAVATPPVGPPGARNKKKKKKGKKQSLDANVPQQNNHNHNHIHEYEHDHRFEHQHYAQYASRLDYSNSQFDSPELVDADQDDYFSDEEPPYEDGYNYQPNPSSHHPILPSTAQQQQQQPTGAKKKKNKKKKKGGRNGEQSQQDTGSVGSGPRNNSHGHGGSGGSAVAKGKDRIWNTSTNEERERIKEFWLSLGEEERRSLVKVEKEAVLRKMKEQQKHSCSCSVCGRKRTAIEEELEVLYDAYYEELEQYANQQQGRFIPSISNGDAHSHYPHRHSHRNHLPPSSSSSSAPQQQQQQQQQHMQRNAAPSGLQHHMDDIDDDEFDDDEDDYDDEDEDVDDGIVDDPRPDFFNFGNSLTVKGGILTVADDLLKNDGKKFIEMMEQLAERRMQREEEATSSMHSNTHNYSGPMIPPNQSMHHAHPSQQPQYDDEEEDDEDYDEEEEDYDEDEEDEADTMTEEQRMEEGRRMFQIFAARMFEQRVLTAYREKVAQERQRKLLEELEEENRLKEEREQKKLKEKEKKKDKKRQQKLAREEEKQRREAEKAAEEAAQRAIEEKKAEEARKRKEEQRLKKEAERRAQEEERQRKEEERRRRIAEEKEREAERERKRKEAQEAERKQREEAQRRAKEEKEQRAREARERREKEERERREKEAKAKKEAEEKERLRREEEAKQRAELQAQQKANQNAALQSQIQATIPLTSPRPPIATPALPKNALAPSPGRQQQAAMPSPKTPQAAPRVNTSISPNHAQSVSPSPLKQATPMFAPQNPPPGLQPANSPHISNIAPPPGVPLPQDHPFSNLGSMPPLNGVPMGPFPGMPQRSLSNRMPMYPPPLGNGFSAFVPPAVTPLQTPPPPGMMPPQARSAFPPAGLPNTPIPPLGPMSSPFMRSSHPMPVTTAPIGTRPMGSMDAGSAPRPIPAPIQRPQSVAPRDSVNGEEVNQALGSSALVADDDDSILTENFPLGRRGSAAARPRMGPFATGLGGGFMGGDPLLDMFSSPIHRTDWRNPTPFANSLPTSWGTPTSTATAWPDLDLNRNTSFFNTSHRLPNLRRLAIRVLTDHSAALTNGTPPSQPQQQQQETAFMSLQDFHNSLRSAAQATDFGTPDDVELQFVCELEGDLTNGGGRFEIVTSSPPSTSATSDTSAADTTTTASIDPKAHRKIRWIGPTNSLVGGPEHAFGSAIGGAGMGGPTQPPPGLGDVQQQQGGQGQQQGSPGLKGGQGAFGGFVRVGGGMR